MILRQHPTLLHIFVSDDGRIFQELAVSPSYYGYHTVKIGNGQARPQTMRRHTLVAEAFHGPRPPGMGARHLDDNPGNDHPDNLRWGTQTENMADAIARGAHMAKPGERNHNAKLTDAQAREIIRRRAAGEAGRFLAQEFGISESRVCDLHKGRTAVSKLPAKKP